MSLFGATDKIQIYRQAFADTWAEAEAIEKVRFVVLDCETTGVDAKKDALVSIGAIAVQGNEILLEDQFEVLLKVAYNTSSVVVHGVTREGAAEVGLEEADALRHFLGYLQDGVIVGHHIGFDVEILSNACQRRFGMNLSNRWLDTMELTMHLEDAGVLGAKEERKDFSLDGLCRRFNIVPHGRHTATGDAFITAQIFLKLLALAKKTERSQLGAVLERYVFPEAEH